MIFGQIVAMTGLFYYDLYIKCTQLGPQ